MRRLRLRPVTFVLAIVLLFGYNVVVESLSGWQPYAPGGTIVWGAVVAYAAALILLLSLVLGSRRNSESTV